MQLIGFYPIKMTQMDNIIVVECTQKASAKMIGRIVDKHSRPVDFANVALLNVRDSSFITGGVTNENGQFVIPCEARKAIVKVSCVGYQTASHLYETGKIGNITLHENTVNLKGVTIRAIRNSFKMGKEGLMVNIENSDLAKIGTATDILREAATCRCGVRWHGECVCQGNSTYLHQQQASEKQYRTGAVEIQ